jgi:hypothetical protein
MEVPATNSRFITYLLANLAVGPKFRPGPTAVVPDPGDRPGAY